MNKNKSITSKGLATSFGFRRPGTAPSSLTASNQVVARRLAFTDSTDSNGNDRDTKSLTENFQTNGRSTPRLPPPKKEGNATQGVARFGFRQTNVSFMFYIDISLLWILIVNRIQWQSSKWITIGSPNWCRTVWYNQNIHNLDIFKKTRCYATGFVVNSFKFKYLYIITMITKKIPNW